MFLRPRGRQCRETDMLHLDIKVKVDLRKLRDFVLALLLLTH
jgi:hypothetical protein